LIGGLFNCLLCGIRAVGKGLFIGGLHVIAQPAYIKRTTLEIESSNVVLTAFSGSGIPARRTLRYVPSGGSLGRVGISPCALASPFIVDETTTSEIETDETSTS
jgi:hypothetical protein